MSAAYLAAVAWITLGPRPYDDGTGEVLEQVLAWLASMPATAWITFDVVEFTANVAMFVPLGILAVLWFGGRRWWAAPLAGLVLSGAIEACQGLLLASRVADARDLIANTLGAVIGMLALLALRRWRRAARASRAS